MQTIVRFISLHRFFESLFAHQILLKKNEVIAYYLRSPEQYHDDRRQI